MEEKNTHHISLTELARIAKCRRYNIKAYMDLGLITPVLDQKVTTKSELFLNDKDRPETQPIEKVTPRYSFTYEDVETVKKLMAVGSKRKRRTS